MQKFLVLICLFLVARSVKFNGVHLGPSIVYPMRGEFIDLTKKPYIVNNHEADG